MMSLKNIRVLLVLTLAMQSGSMFGMMARLRPDCRWLAQKLIALALPSAAHCIKHALPATEFLKRDGEAWLINRELAKPQSASMLLERIQLSHKLEPQAAPGSSYGKLLGDIIAEAADGMFSTWYGHGHWDSEFLLNIIVTELKHSDYRSFFHGASGQLRVLFDLQKELAKDHGIEVPDAFEFLRAPIGRSYLKCITAEKYVKDWSSECIARWGTNTFYGDERDPRRTELLSVDRSLYYSHHLFHSNHSYAALNMYDWVVQALSVHELPMPYDLQTFGELFPRVSQGLFVHVLLRDKCADRLVYRATMCGHPLGYWRMPDKDQELDDYPAQEYRIILDPTVFDEPNSDVQMHIHQKLSSEERKQIDQFIAQLIHDAKKLKKQKEFLIR